LRKRTLLNERVQPIIADDSRVLILTIRHPRTKKCRHGKTFDLLQGDPAEASRIDVRKKTYRPTIAWQDIFATVMHMESKA
jgi:hypothetical protein